MSATPQLRPAGLGSLLRLRLAILRNRVRGLRPSGWLKTAAVASLTAGFLLGECALTRWLLDSLLRNEDLPPLFVLALAERLLGLVFLVCLSMLFFSNVTASLATLYLSRDLDLLLATPVPPARVFALKLVETLINSSYMVVLFVAPILAGYGLAFAAPALFYLQVPVVLLLLILPPASAGVLLTLLLMRYLPARRTYQALSAIGLMLAVSFVTALRLLAPERLLRPTSTEDFAAILRALTVPAAEWLPSAWAARLELSVLQRAPWPAAASFASLALVAAASLALLLALARPLYFRGVAASHEAGHRRRPRAGVPCRRLGLAGRDLRLFFRDPAQWSQLLLLGALVVIYVFNITALPQDLIVVGTFVTIRDVVAWINVGLAGFVLAAIGMRFVLPSVSMEGGAFWIVAASPARRSAYVLRKLALFGPPMLLFSLSLVWLSGRALKVDHFTLLLSLATAALVTLTLTALAVGLGTAFPAFRLENPAQFVLTGGGVLYGVLSLVYVVAVVALEARPFFWHLLAAARALDPATVEPRPYYAMILLLSGLLTFGSLGFGLRRIQRMET